MTLAAGTRFGPYEITGTIGAGGMGEVYRARDTKLKRDVALKVLPEAFASDPERMARFQREAEVLASLNHPNIAHIYGIEDRALVMELVEGESPRGPMPFDEAWHIASQIAAALEYAHERGVVHRDLKPANLKVTPDGVVKLLDFGLAKAFNGQGEGAVSSDNDLANSPTLTISPTRAGMILGTAAYMAPEQARGKSVDKRADIWAFGCVLYELLTGEKLFQGEDVADTLAHVLTKQPDLTRVPQKVRRVLQSCLEKDPKNRLRDIGDAWRQLDDDSAAAIAPRSSVSRSVLLWGAAAVLAVAVAALSFLYFRGATAPRTVQRFTIAMPDNTNAIHSLAISPDGRYVAIAAIINNKQQLWLRALDSLQAEAMPGTDDASFPFWSPDSRYIGFFAQGKLRKVAAGGGPPQDICDAPNGRGGTWNRDGVIVFAPAPGGVAIQRVSAAGGVPADLTKITGTSRFPAFLPDGNHFVYVVNGASPEEDGIHLSSLDGKENKRILADLSSAVVGVGRLLFLRGGTLVAQPFDAAGNPVGDALPVANGMSFTTVTQYAPVTTSDTGVLLYESGTGQGFMATNQLTWLDRGGKVLGTVGAPGPVREAAISPDEKSVAFQGASTLGVDLWLRDLNRGAEQRFTTDPPATNVAPFWSPQGDRIVFRSKATLFEKAASGGAEQQLLPANGNLKQATQWSRDGRYIVYDEQAPKTRLDIWVLPMDQGTERKPVPFLQTEFNELSGQLSPDSRWMAYQSDESGQYEIYVRPFPSGEDQRKISLAGGTQPRWRGDGKELFFLAADGKMMAVTANATAGAKSSFEAGAPQALFDTHLPALAGSFGDQYDVTADGKRFLVETAVGASAAATPLDVVLNWDAGLKK